MFTDWSETSQQHGETEEEGMGRIQGGNLVWTSSPSKYSIYKAKEYIKNKSWISLY